MMLKRIYDFEAAKKEWVSREDVCETCEGKGVVVNESLDGVEACPAGADSSLEGCVDGVRTRLVPPVVGVRVVRAGSRQKFSPKLVDRGRAEGWLALEGSTLVISGENKRLTYQVNRVPGRYGAAGDGLQQINYYDCELVGAAALEEEEEG